MFRFHVTAAVVLVSAALLPCPAAAGVVRFNAVINAAQETTGSTSAAQGTAVLLYEPASNQFDLTISLSGLSNTLSNSHIHEAAPGADGGVVVTLGPEANYERDGNNLTASFANLEYTGAVANLLAGGAYLNFHTGPWPGGEVRGQLIPEPVRLAGLLNAAQEVTGTNPPVNSEAYGAAQAVYDPATNRISTLVFVYHFSNTLTDSHIHEAPRGSNGGVRVGFGGAANYEKSGHTYAQLFADRTYGGTPAQLLADGAYVNIHSNVHPAGEIRGQLEVVALENTPRLANVAARGLAGTGTSALIGGMFVAGNHPLRVLVTARGPVLTPFGITDALSNPMLTVYDGAGRLLFSNDDVGSAPFASLIDGSGFKPTLPAEAGLLLLLPPGAYTAIVSGAGGSSGIALMEAFELDW